MICPDAEYTPTGLPYVSGPASASNGRSWLGTGNVVTWPLCHCISR